MNNHLSDEEMGIVNEIIREQLEVGLEQITSEALLEQDLGADSLDIAEISITIEERFNVTVPDAAWEHEVAVGDVYEALAETLRPKGKRDLTPSQ